MTILFLTHYFPPEVGAPQSRIDELTQQLARRGHRIWVLANYPHYPTGTIPPEYRSTRTTVEQRGMVTVVRTYVWARPNRGFAWRILNHLSFTASSILAGAKLPRFDVVVTESPPLFLGFSGWLISRMLGARHVFNVADVWPQSAVEMGALRNGVLIGLAEWLERFIYRHSHAVSVVTEGIRQDLMKRGLDGRRLWTLTNGVDLEVFRPGRGASKIRGKLGLKQSFTVLYAGTHGMAQGLDVAINCAGLLKGRTDIAFILAGDGAEKDRLVEMARDRGLTNVRFLDTWPKRDMPSLWAAADACLVCLKDLPVFWRALPSKTYEAMAMEKPVVVSARGMIADLVEQAGAGVVAGPEDPQSLADAIISLQNRPRAAREMGRRGRQYVARHFSRQGIVAKWEELFRWLVQNPMENEESI